MHNLPKRQRVCISRQSVPVTQINAPALIPAKRVGTQFTYL